MSVRDDRLPPFAWVALEALDLIRSESPAGTAASVRTVYLGLAELASRAHDGKQGRTKSTKAALVDAAGVSAKTVSRACEALSDLGLVVVEERRDEDGRTLPTLFRLSSVGGNGVHPGGTKVETDSTPITRTGDETKKEEPPTADRAAARASDDQWPDGIFERRGQCVLDVLVALGQQHGAKVITKRALGHAMLGAPGRDYLAEAHKLASWAAERQRPVRDVVATYRNWLGNAPQHYEPVTNGRPQFALASAGRAPTEAQLYRERQARRAAIASGEVPA